MYNPNEPVMLRHACAYKGRGEEVGMLPAANLLGLWLVKKMRDGAIYAAVHEVPATYAEVVKASNWPRYDLIEAAVNSIDIGRPLQWYYAADDEEEVVPFTAPNVLVQDLWTEEDLDAWEEDGTRYRWRSRTDEEMELEAARPVMTTIPGDSVHFNFTAPDRIFFPPDPWEPGSWSWDTTFLSAINRIRMSYPHFQENQITLSRSDCTDYESKTSVALIAQFPYHHLTSVRETSTIFVPSLEGVRPIVRNRYDVHVHQNWS